MKADVMYRFIIIILITFIIIIIIALLGIEEASPIKPPAATTHSRVQYYYSPINVFTARYIQPPSCLVLSILLIFPIFYGCMYVYRPRIGGIVIALLPKFYLIQRSI